MVVSGSWSISGLHRETTVLSLVMAYRSFGRFRRASTRLDTPPCSGRHHPVSAIAPPPAVADIVSVIESKAAQTALQEDADGPRFAVLRRIIRRKPVRNPIAA